MSGLQQESTMGDAFILTDMAGERAWHGGTWFLPLDHPYGEVTIFPTRAAAEAAVRRLRKEDCYLRVHRIDLDPDRLTVVEDPSTVTTFTYSGPGPSSLLRGSPEEKDLRRPLANGRPKRKRPRKAIATKASGRG
jgi:hypothetical protein